MRGAVRIPVDNAWDGSRYCDAALLYKSGNVEGTESCVEFLLKWGRE